MKLYKTETHLHTAEISSCGWLKAAEMVEHYHAAGYQTVFVTDHFAAKFFDSLAKDKIGYQEGVHRFFEGYRLAKDAAKPYGMNIIAGAEISLAVPHGHFLLYGENVEAFLSSVTDAYRLMPKEFHEVASKNGMFVVQAHPFRKEVGAFPDCIDGIEVHNTNPRHLTEEREEETRAIAKSHHLPISGGSDAHRIEDVGRGGILTNVPVTSATDLIQTFMNGNYEIIGCEAGQ